MTATGAEYDDEGGASRFFPVFRYEAKAPSSERPRDGETAHPTVKPLDLMRWLVRLVTPPGGTVLEPFAGSGTTAEACVIEGFKCIAIEREADYLSLIAARLAKPIQIGLDFGEVS
jgi:site-specific DNA-methyltransferase (adenine-specific)